MDKISKGLNPAQAEAVNTLGGPLLILAGAGSGKTKTLTHRIANLISHGIDPHRILAVTFTNKAAREMRDRLWQLLQHDTPSTPQDDQQPPRSFMPYMGTFHSIAVKIDVFHDLDHIAISTDKVLGIIEIIEILSRSFVICLR